MLARTFARIMILGTREWRVHEGADEVTPASAAIGASGSFRWRRYLRQSSSIVSFGLLYLLLNLLPTVRLLL